MELLEGGCAQEMQFDRSGEFFSMEWIKFAKSKCATLEDSYENILSASLQAKGALKVLVKGCAH